MLKNRLKESRERLGLTQKQVASVFNVHESTVSGWETGKDTIPLKKLIKYCELFDYSIDYILYISKFNQKYESLRQINPKIIGDNLKKLRIKNNHSQEDVANFIKISQSCYSNYEKGKELITTFAIYTISTTYMVSIDKIIGKKEKEKITS